MCGRYAAGADPDELVEEYRIDEVTADGRDACVPRFNIAPTDTVPAVVEREAETGLLRKLVGLRWGLVPSWSKDAGGGARMINARVETVTEKPAYRRAMAARRCLLPALGYYEWRPEKIGDTTLKQPYFLRPADGSMVHMAGIYEFWKGPDGWLATASIITTSATDELGWVHDRMPMTVTDRDLWLDPGLTAGETARELLVPLPHLAPTKVSRAVNSVANDGADLLLPIE
ncbi:SOS response-associated peptidase [Tessaracoccus antarcticus]|uniref:Abasic site processing protein n=1 Tax=Tessaracoccus antarcticus TaxID=2479848 RepID=A0A3M0GBE8_9ACTN|nr:SOS response-associated peptidase [Tessaracoccus antarcticus]RMB58863.1 SOS response-associated peptidase [Tessaracoccus antarcticus]